MLSRLDKNGANDVSSCLLCNNALTVVIQPCEYYEVLLLLLLSLNPSEVYAKMESLGFQPQITACLPYSP